MVRHLASDERFDGPTEIVRRKEDLAALRAAAEGADELVEASADPPRELDAEVTALGAYAVAFEDRRQRADGKGASADVAERHVDEEHLRGTRLLIRASRVLRSPTELYEVHRESPPRRSYKRVQMGIDDLDIPEPFRPRDPPQALAVRDWQ